MGLSVLSEGERNQAEKRLDELTSSGLRVVALASKSIPSRRKLSLKKEGLRKEVSSLILLGFVALKDPIRKGAKEAVRIAREAGLKTVIATGDHLLTAKAVAKELNLATKKENLLEGKDLDALSDRELDSRLSRLPQRKKTSKILSHPKAWLSPLFF